MIAAPPGWVDVHHHAYHPRLVEALASYGVTEMAPGVPVPRWSPDDTFGVMERCGLTAVVLSILLPDEAVRSGGAEKLVRSANEWTAELVDEHPRRLAGLATLPLTDVDGSVAEIDRGLLDLGLAGVVLPASLPDGRLLGDPSLEPVFAALDRHRAVVLIHPNPAVRCGCTGGDAYADAVPAPLVDFVVDTTRAVAQMVLRGVVTRFPGVRFVLAHGGGTLPYLVGRLELAASWVSAGNPWARPEAIRESVRGLYFETAQATGRGALECLRREAEPGHVLFGTDFPFMREPAVLAGRRAVEAHQAGPDGPAGDIGRDALALFPALRGKG